MAGPEQEGAAQRRHVRIPVDAKVDLVYDSFASFISDYVSNVSRGGMFIATTQVRPPGTRLTFELRLRDDYPLIRGRGEVVWVRRDGAGDAERATGMAVRFLELDQQSGELIERMVEQHRSEGGTPFAIEADASSDSSGDSGGEPVLPAASGEEGEPQIGGGEAGEVFTVPESSAQSSDREPRVGSTDVFARPVVEPEAARADDAATGPPPTSWPVREELPPMEPFGGEEPQEAEQEVPLGFGFSDEAVSVPERTAGQETFSGGGSVMSSPRRPRRLRRRWPLVAGAVSLVVVVGAAVALWQLGLITLPFLGGTSSRPVAAARPEATPPGPAQATPVPAPAEKPAAEASAVTGAVASPAPAVAAAATAQPARPTPAPVAPAEPATEVESVTWRREGPATVLKIATNGRVERSRLKDYRLESPPRQVIRIAGIRVPYADRPLDVGGPLLARVRVGFHPEMSPPELHVVVDLTDAGVRLEGLEVSGTDVVLRFIHE